MKELRGRGSNRGIPRGRTADRTERAKGDGHGRKSGHVLEGHRSHRCIAALRTTTKKVRSCRRHSVPVSALGSIRAVPRHPRPRSSPWPDRQLRGRGSNRGIPRGRTADRTERATGDGHGRKSGHVFEGRRSHRCIAALRTTAKKDRSCRRHSVPVSALGSIRAFPRHPRQRSSFVVRKNEPYAVRRTRTRPQNSDNASIPAPATHCAGVSPT